MVAMAILVEVELAQGTTFRHGWLRGQPEVAIGM